MEDVARRAGVSPMTVSRALRDPDKVAPATRARIASAVAELDYVPDLIASGLAAKHSRLAAVIVSTLEQSIFASTIEGLTTVLGGAGYAVLLGSSGYSSEVEENLVRATLGRRPDGLMLTGDLHTAAARRLLRASGVPVVETWELPAEPIDLAVGFSNRAAGAAMVEALHGFGYRRIALVGTGGAGDRRAQLRREGYRQAIEALGIGPPRELILPDGVASITQGPQLLQTLRRDHPDADAAFCVVDSLAAGLLLACRRAGIAVPTELAIAGFGDFEIAHPAALDLTTVRVSGREIGRLAGEMLLARMTDQAVEPAVRDVGFSIVRRSSA
jgi:LacI family gluconate utilization system Gnt-I transcriptional repressor